MSDRKRVFILGSGFSKQLSQGTFPTGEDLLKKLIDSKAIKNSNFYRHIHQSPHNNNSDSLMKVLSRIDLDDFLPFEEKDLLKHEILKELQEYLSTMKLKKESSFELDPAKYLVKNLFRAGDMVISFNWDILLEHLLCLNHKDNTDNPLLTWGKIFCAFLDDPMGSVTELSDFVVENTSSGLVHILKPHGSFNFIPIYSPQENAIPNDKIFLKPATQVNYSHSRKETYYDGTLYWHPSVFLDGRLAYDQESLFPGLKTIESPEFPSRNPNFSTQNPKLVSPSYVRALGCPELREIWKISFEEISKSNLEIIIIGYGFPPEDILTRNLINQSRNSNNIYKILGENEEELKRKLAEFGLADPNYYTLYTKPSLGSWNKAYESLIKDLGNGTA